MITTNPMMQSSSLNLGYPQCLLGIEVFVSPTWQTRYRSSISQEVTFNSKVCGTKPSIPLEEIRFVLAAAEIGTNNCSASLRGRRRGVTSLPGAAPLPPVRGNRAGGRPEAESGCFRASRYGEGGDPPRSRRGAAFLHLKAGAAVPAEVGRGDTCRFDGWREGAGTRQDPPPHPFRP